MTLNFYFSLKLEVGIRLDGSLIPFKNKSSIKTLRFKNNYVTSHSFENVFIEKYLSNVMFMTARVSKLSGEFV